MIYRRRGMINWVEKSFFSEFVNLFHNKMTKINGGYKQ